MIFFLLRLAVAAILLANGGDSRPGGFKIIGPGGGGAMFHPIISPHDSSTVLVSCDMTGSYITHDAGKSWRMFNLRGVVQFFVFDPLDRKVIYAQSNGLWRSQDEGESWSLIYPKPSSVKSIKMSSDHSDEDLVAEPNLPGLKDKLWGNPHSPADARILLLAGPNFSAKRKSSGVERISGPSAKTSTDTSVGFGKDGKALIYIIGDESAFV